MTVEQLEEKPFEAESSEDYFDELEYSSFNSGKMRNLSSKFLNKNEIAFIIVGAGIFIAIFFFIISVTKRHQIVNETDLQSVNERLQIIEERLTAIQTAEDKPFTLEAESKELDNLTKHYEEMENTLTEELHRLTQKINEIERSIQIFQSTNTPTPADPNPPIVQADSGSNPQTFHTVRPGDTLYSISKRYDITLDDLYRINQFSPGEKIYPGQKLSISE